MVPSVSEANEIRPDQRAKKHGTRLKNYREKDSSAQFQQEIITRFKAGVSKDSEFLHEEISVLLAILGRQTTKNDFKISRPLMIRKMMLTKELEVIEELLNSPS